MYGRDGGNIHECFPSKYPPGSAENDVFMITLMDRFMIINDAVRQWDSLRRPRYISKQGKDGRNGTDGSLSQLCVSHTLWSSFCSDLTP